MEGKEGELCVKWSTGRKGVRRGMKRKTREEGQGKTVGGRDVKVGARRADDRSH